MFSVYVYVDWLAFDMYGHSIQHDFQHIPEIQLLYLSEHITSQISIITYLPFIIFFLAPTPTASLPVVVSVFPVMTCFVGDSGFWPSFCSTVWWTVECFSIFCVICSIFHVISSLHRIYHDVIGLLTIIVPLDRNIFVQVLIFHLSVVVSGNGICNGYTLKYTTHKFNFSLPHSNQVVNKSVSQNKFWPLLVYFNVISLVTKAVGSLSKVFFFLQTACLDCCLCEQYKFWFHETIFIGCLYSLVQTACSWTKAEQGIWTRHTNKKFIFTFVKDPPGLVLKSYTVCVWWWKNTHLSLVFWPRCKSPKTLIFPTILNKVKNVLVAKWGYEEPQSSGPNKFQVACGYWAMTKAYTAPIIGFFFEMTTKIQTGSHLDFS